MKPKNTAYNLRLQIADLTDRINKSRDNFLREELAWKVRQLKKELEQHRCKEQDAKDLETVNAQRAFDFFSSHPGLDEVWVGEEDDHWVIDINEPDEDFFDHFVRGDFEMEQLSLNYHNKEQHGPETL